MTDKNEAREFFYVWARKKFTRIAWTDKTTIGAVNEDECFEVMTAYAAALTQKRDELRAAIVEFHNKRGYHMGEHDSEGGVQCSGCVAAYNKAEAKLDAAAEESQP